MKQPTVGGRVLPHQDWEGDDHPAAVAFTTCSPTAGGEDVAFATNGRVVHDGSFYRAAAPPLSQPPGLTLPELAIAIHKAVGLELVIPPGWGRANVQTQLRYARGLIVNAPYSAIPRQYRWQQAADFWHSIFVSHLTTTGNAYVYDPLNPRVDGYGVFIPAQVIYDLAAAGGYQVAYVPLQKL